MRSCPRKLVAPLAIAFVVLSVSAGSAQAAQMRIHKFTAERFQSIPGPRTITGTDTGWVSGNPLRVNVSSTPETRAGAHPDMVMSIEMCGENLGQASNYGCVSDDYSRRIRDLKLSLPPGLLGNPSNVPTCAYGLWLIGACPDSAIVGWTRADPVQPPNIGQTSVPSYIYNVQTLGFEPARLGTGWLGQASPPTPVESLVSVRTDGDFGIDALTPNIPPGWQSAGIKIREIYIVLFGLAGPANKPFFVNPTKCGESKITARIESYLGPPNVNPSNNFPTAQDATTVDEKTAVLNTTGCENPGDSDDFTFDDSNAPPGEDEQPSIDVKPDTSQAGAPTGYEVKLKFPNSENWDRRQAHLRNADVTLPSGVGLSPAAGKDLAGCTPDQFGVEGSPADFPSGLLDTNNDPVKCPTASEIGTVEIATPVLPDTLKGKAYFAKPAAPGRPTDANPWKLLMAVEGSGLLVKLAGDVTVDEDGTVHTKFVDQPQTPFTEFKLKLNGGAKSVLQNPRTCETRTGRAEFTGWNGGKAVSEPTIVPTGCSDPEPFNLSVNGKAENEDAGASSPSRLTIERPDGNQLLKDLDLSLPAGLVGSLNTVPLCGAAAVESGACSDDSKIGTLRVTVGTDGSQIEVPGSLYLAQPTAPADVATLGVVIPAKVGPIDLGDVVVTNHVRLRQADGGLDALLGVSKLRSPGGSFSNLDKLPTRLGGIPLAVKRINIDVDRPGFLTNPTGCDPRQLKGFFGGDLGGRSEPSVSLTALNCGKLPFSPKLRLIVPGGSQNTHKGRGGLPTHTPLRAIVSQPAGQASIKRAVVKLPSPLRPDTVQLNRPGVLCTTAQATIGACQPQAQVGTASVITPLLPEPLSGPVYIVQDPGNVLPKLLVQLRGMAAIDLVAGNRIEGFRTVNTFDNLPDVPQSQFDLSINGGPSGILFNFSELCDDPSSADATFTGHNGAVSKSQPELEVEGCGSSVGRFSLRGGKLKVSKGGIVSVRVRCPSSFSCTGRLAIERTVGKRKRIQSLGSKSFSIAANKTKTIKVKLRRSARRQVARRNKGLKVRLSGKASTFTVTQSATLVKTKQKRAKRR